MSTPNSIKEVSADGVGSKKFPENRPRRLLIIGYFRLDEIYAKGLIRDDIPETFNLAFNFGGYFDEVYVFIPFGRSLKIKTLQPNIIYHELSSIPKGRENRFMRGGRRLLKAVKALREVSLEFKPDVIQVCGPHLPNLVFAFSGLKKKYASTCFIEAYWEDIIVHQNYIPKIMRAFFPFYYRFVYYYHDFFFGAPSLNREYYTSRGMGEQKIANWVQLVDLNLVNASQKLDDPVSFADKFDVRIVTVGRLHEEKCTLDAIDVLIKVRNAGVNACLVLVGDGELRAEIEHRVAQYELETCVCITGLLGICDGMAAVWHSDIYFAPMQGSALLEGLATGRPVVAYDHETHRAAIGASGTGILVPHRDVSGAAQQIVALANEPDRAKALGAKAFSYWQEKLEPLAMANIVNEAAYKSFNAFKKEGASLAQ